MTADKLLIFFENPLHDGDLFLHSSLNCSDLCAMAEQRLDRARWGKVDQKLCPLTFLMFGVPTYLAGMKIVGSGTRMVIREIKYNEGNLVEHRGASCISSPFGHLSI